MSANWSFHHLEECESTFMPARKASPWSVTYATRQTHGRGRFNRTWFGSEGGLWACYNVPIDESAHLHWGMLPLVAGAALFEALQNYKIEGVRLRWPNDLLVGRSKLAGILVERPQKHMASIGIGLNMFNDVAALRSLTTDPPVRLCELMPACPSVDKMCQILAASIDSCYKDFLLNGTDSIQTRLEKTWGRPRPVVAITDAARHCGFFSGVSADGSPILRQADGSQCTVPGIEVNRLFELD